MIQVISPTGCPLVLGIGAEISSLRWLEAGSRATTLHIKRLFPWASWTWVIGLGVAAFTVWKLRPWVNKFGNIAPLPVGDRQVGVRQSKPSKGGFLVPMDRKLIRLLPQKVFVVHGHNQVVRLEVTRLIERQGLEAVILCEQDPSGKTIIEQLEAYTDDVDYAIVLLTPDDEGRVAGSSAQLRPRARQNVILEAGYLMKRLGRARVCLLYWPGVELPSDLSGVLYVPYDQNGAWKYAVTRAMKCAGLRVELDETR